MRISLLASLVLSAILSTGCTNPHDDKSVAGDNVGGDQSLSVEGNELALWVFGDSTMGFGGVEVGTTSTRVQTITYNGEEAITMVVVSPNSGVWLADATELTFTPGGSRSVTVSFTPPSEGSFAAGIELAASDDSTSFGCEGSGVVTLEESAVDNDGDGLTEDEGDCNDGDAGINPDATDLCDGVDNDCDGVDGNGDCDDTEPATDVDGDGYTAEAGDCDDGSAAINPAADEICNGAGIDEDCDGLSDEEDPDCSDPDTGGTDTGGDTGSDSGDTGGDTGDSGDTGGDTDTGSSDPDTDGDGDPDSSDCDDTNPAIYTGADEICGNTIDEDCDGSDEVCDDYDADDDGYEGTSGDGSDCDDTDALVNPGADEVCGDGQDNDCDGMADNLPNLSFVFSAPGDGPQPFSGVTVYGYSDTGTWNCSGSDGPINLSICTDDDSVYQFTDAAEIAAYKSSLQGEVDAWVASAPLVDSDGASYSAVEWVTSSNVDTNVCVFLGVEIAAPY